jgi:hypothetical protein
MSRVLYMNRDRGRGLARADDEVTPEGLAAALADLDDRVQALRRLGVRGRARAIAGLARWWLAACDARPGEPPGPRGMPDTLDGLLRRGCEEAGVSLEMLRWGIREALGNWTEPALVALVERELGSTAALDHDAGAPGARTVAMAPRLCLQVLARTVPPAGWQSVALAWLLGSAVLIRPSTHLATLMEAFALSLVHAAPELAAVTWVACSPADDTAWHRALASHADAMVIHGSDDAVAAWQAVARRDALVVAHGHRVSAAFLAAAGLDEPALSENLRGLALDLCAWDQTGCLSPVTLYVEASGPVGPDEIARRLVDEALPAIEAALPPGPWDAGVLAERTLFVRARMLEASVHASRTAHVLAFADTAPIEGSCLHRVLVVRPVASVDALVATLQRSAPRLQALAVGGPAGLRASLAGRLATSGLNRVCAPGQMQRPPLAWSHDGRGCLRPLVRWIDIE